MGMLTDWASGGRCYLCLLFQGPFSSSRSLARKGRSGPVTNILFSQVHSCLLPLPHLFRFGSCYLPATAALTGPPRQTSSWL